MPFPRIYFVLNKYLKILQYCTQLERSKPKKKAQAF